MPGRRNNHPSSEATPAEERQRPQNEGAQTGQPGVRPQHGNRPSQGRRPRGRIPRTGNDQDNQGSQTQNGSSGGPEGQAAERRPDERQNRNNQGLQNGRGQGRGYHNRNQNRRGPSDRENRPSERGPETAGERTGQAGPLPEHSGPLAEPRGQQNPRQNNNRRGRDGQRREGGQRNPRSQSNQPRSQYRNEGGMTTREPDTEQPATRGPQDNQGPTENTGFAPRANEGRPDNRGPNNRRRGGRGGSNRGQNRDGQNRGQNRGQFRGQPTPDQPVDTVPSAEGAGNQNGDRPRYGDQPRRDNPRRQGDSRSNRGGNQRPVQPQREGMSGKAQGEVTGEPAGPQRENSGNNRQGQGSRGNQRSHNNRGGQDNRNNQGSFGPRSQRNRYGRSTSGERQPQGEAPTGGPTSGADQSQPGNQNSSRRKPHSQRTEHAPYIPPNGEVVVESHGAGKPRRQRQPQRERAPQSDRAPRRQRENGYERGEGYYSFTGYNADRPAPTVPIRTNQGIKARSQRGQFSKNWWARRWIEAMEQLVDPGRLQRGRSYARSGQVLSLDETTHGIEARVQGSRPKPYEVTIQVTPLTDEQWDQVIDALSEQALFTAQLLAGEMPSNIEDAFNTAQVSLFPAHAGDLFSSCSCPDWANPCKHVAATHYILGDRFDDDPFLLFRMRGRSQEQILQALRARRAGQSELPVEEAEPEVIETEAAQPLEESLEHFWEPIEPLDTFPLTIRPPSMDMPLLMRLGEPAFLVGESLRDLLKPVYDTFTRQALRAAYSEEEPLEPANGNGDNADDADTQHANGAALTEDADLDLA